MHAAVLSLALALASIPTTPATVSAPSEQRYVWITLHGGRPDPMPSAERIQELSAGHFENIGRLTDAGSLLLAGPYGAEKSADDLRGIFLFDVETVGEARALCASDPAVAAGLLTVEAYPFTTDWPVRRLPELNRARKCWCAANIE